MSELQSLLRIYLSHPSADGIVERRDMRRRLLEMISTPAEDQSAYALAMTRLAKVEAENLELRRRAVERPRLELPEKPAAPRQPTRRKQFLHDLTQGKCFHCGMELSILEMTVDHLYPKSLGGTDARTNLVPSCGPCNFAKGDTPPSPEMRQRLLVFLDAYNKRRLQSAGLLPEKPAVKLEILTPPAPPQRDKGMSYTEYQKHLGR